MVEPNRTKLEELTTDGPVVFYDGVCGLCNSFVQILIKLDKRRILRYATLQGDTARELLGELSGEADGWTVVLADRNGVYERSAAAIRAIAYVGGTWKALKGFLIVPRAVRDAVYRWVARNRYRWFGKEESCMLPSPQVRQRFLP